LQLACWQRLLVRQLLLLLLLLCYTSWLLVRAMHTTPLLSHGYILVWLLLLLYKQRCRARCWH